MSRHGRPLPDIVADLRKRSPTGMLDTGLALASPSLGSTHLALAGTLTGLALARPRPWVRRLVLGLGGVLTLLVPLHWLGPLWSAGPERGAFLLGFYQRFALSLAIPFGLGAVTVALLARRPTRPRALGAGALTVAAYVLGLVASFPVSFNYALLYPLLR